MNIQQDPSEWDFRTVTEDELETAIEYEYIRESPLLIKKAATKNFLGKFDPLEFFLMDFPAFPKPWTKLSANEKCLHFHNPKLRIVSIRDAEQQTRLKGWHFAMHVPFGEISLEKITAQFQQWLKAEAKSHPSKPRGKGSSRPWGELKALAARRLSKIPQSALLTHLKKYEMDHPIQCANDVLPRYTSNAKALIAAELKLKKIEAEFLLPISGG